MTPNAYIGNDGGQHPVRGGLTRRRFSMPVTYSVMLVCLLIFLGEQLFPQLLYAGALRPADVLSEPWRMLSYAFLHSPDSWGHLGGNMVFLWVFGRMLEPIIGSQRFSWLLLASLVSGAVFVLLLSPPMGYTVGFSGALFGLIGAVFVLQVKNRENVVGILVLLGLNLALSFFQPSTSWECHLGGMLGGLIFSLVVFRRRRAL